MFSAILTIDKQLGLAKSNNIPWKYLEDLKFFKTITANNVVIMGRKTWDLLPMKYKPLPDRFNVVISKNEIKDIFCPNIVFNSVDDCVEYFSYHKSKYKNQKKIVIGGKSIYEQFFMKNLIFEIYVTAINKIYDCDMFLEYLPDIDECKLEIKATHPDLTFCKYNVINRGEQEMLNLMAYIINNGDKRIDRTGVGTLGVFSRELRFNLNNWNIPLMTTRPVSLRIVFEELMWILRGQTNNKILNNKKINIWDDNTTREFLDKQNLKDLPDGDIGASYGFLMRHYGEKYINCDYEYNGFDQLQYAIDLIKNNPSSRRIIINLWDPTQLNRMVLPPCVYGYQFYVNNNRLSCKMIQRSSDIALAGSHNCSSGALLIFMICAVTGLSPGELIWSPSDIHIYMNQIESVKEQINRIPKPFPILQIIRFPIDNNILNFELNYFKLLNYDPHPKINIAMNA